MQSMAPWVSVGPGGQLTTSASPRGDLRPTPQGNRFILGRLDDLRVPYKTCRDHMLRRHPFVWVSNKKHMGPKQYGSMGMPENQKSIEIKNHRTRIGRPVTGHPNQKSQIEEIYFKSRSTGDRKK